VRQPFLIINQAQVLVDPQQNVPNEVLGAVRVGDPAAHEGAQLRDDLAPGLRGWRQRAAAGGEMSRWPRSKGRNAAGRLTDLREITDPWRDR
jgi:hypothetical protein